MKRSEINLILKKAKAFLEEKQFILPPWGYWGTEDWEKNRDDKEEIIENLLGWDITDFGLGDFQKRGLLLFTIRNGKLNIDKKPYAEKIMIVEENQETPMHFHQSKMEDIINRGGGNLVIELYNSISRDEFDLTPVHFKTDGIKRTINAGGKVILKPGESICLEQGVFHKFYGEPGMGKVLVGEVSMVNDDKSDNYFYGGIGRFPVIEEDEHPLHLLVSDYREFI
jgi:D-lyxose ketol-isomerase